ncbi:porin family protein [Qipengyuania sp. GH25]|uniref:Porin family protein n=1 Tax=Qipengyuania pacifica TaxID=2860199 RepID=A0ABS7JKA5_9SPHN|nr:porin family protein [Qipengyuania aerophila]MBX7489816.1 porin family protein [Qipengyuania aerophila]
MIRIVPSLAILAGALASSPAFADNFDGPYVGVQAGWSQNKVDTLNTSIGPVVIDNSHDEATTGIFAGYNLKPTDKLVLSLEGSFNLGIDDAFIGGTTAIPTGFDPKYSFDVGARAGYLVNDATLLYLRGGYENLRAGVTRSDATNVAYDKDTFDGWSIGGGIERMIADRISTRIEYRYSDLGGDGEKFERHQALIGLAYHF